MANKEFHFSGKNKSYDVDKIGIPMGGGREPHKARSLSHTL